MLSTGTRGLLRLGEMTAPDNLQIRDPSEFSLRARVEFIDDDSFGFWLQTHKTDHAFEGARIIITHHTRLDTPGIFHAYIASRDELFPLNPYLWVTSAGEVPTRSWFMKRFRTIFPDHSFGGQSMRAGGATLLAED
ncbi:hypothetical protein MPER_14835, partial [Moniliophthora perniciosa FA553]